MQTDAMAKDYEPSDVAIKLKSMREKAGISLPKVARHLGWKNSKYQHYEDRYKEKTQPYDMINSIAPLFIERGIDPTEFYALAGAPPPSEYVVTAAPAVAAPRASDSATISAIDGLAPFHPIVVAQPGELRKGLPVLGVAACGNGDDGDFELNGQVIDRVAYPPALVAVKDAYGLYASGSSMEPRYFPGELVYVHPHQPPRTGDFVVVQLRPKHDGAAVRAMIKQLVRRSGSYVELRQYNPAKTFTVDLAEVLAIHKILSGGDLF